MPQTPSGLPNGVYSLGRGSSIDASAATRYSSTLSEYWDRWTGYVLRYTHRTTTTFRQYRPVDRRSSSRKLFGPETLVIPVVFGTKLGNTLPSTTVFELLRQAVCKLSNISHESATNLVASGPLPPELCDAPEVLRNFATVAAMLGVIGGITMMIACGVLSRVSPRYGRKPVFLFILFVEIIRCCLIPGSQFMPEGLSDWVFYFGMLFHEFAGALPFGYLVNMYIVDVCDPEERTTVLGKIGGWSSLGACIPLALGGTITTRTGNPLLVFYIAFPILVSTFIYVALVLPETLPEDMRHTMSSMRREPNVGRTTITTRLASILLVFEPLKMLVPTHKLGILPNWRLIWCAVHSFIFVSAHPFASSAWFVLVTSKYHITPADNGYFFTVVTASSMVFLMVFIPPLIRFLRPYYKRKISYSPLADEGFIESEGLQPETPDRLDIHLAFVSCIFAAVFFLCAVAARTKLALIASAVFIGLSTLHTPTIRSLIAGSVEPLKQGDALGAVEIVDGGSRVLAPIITGGILAMTADTAPQLLFFVHVAVVLISAGLLFRIR